MKHGITIGIIVATVVALAGIALFTGRIVPDSDTVTPTSNQVVAGSPAVDLTLCTKQPNDAYTCPMNALSNFGPITITDTTSKNTCKVSYQKTEGFSFKGATKTGFVKPVLIAVALYPSGKIATIAASAAQTMSIHVGEDGAVDHTLFVDSNYSTEQCLVVR